MIKKEEKPVIILGAGVGFSMAGVHISYLENSFNVMVFFIIALIIFIVCSIGHFVKERKNDK